MTITKAFLLDVDYFTLKGRSALRLSLKRESDGQAMRLYDSSFEPYYYLLPETQNIAGLEELAEKVRGLRAFDRRGAFSAKRVEIVERRQGFAPVKLLKIVTNHPAQVPGLHELTKQFGQDFEHRIAWTKRYLIDKQISPCALVECEHDGLDLNSIRMVANDSKAEPVLDLRLLAFDIETYNPKNMPSPKEDPAIMISFADRNKGGAVDSGVLTFKKIPRDFVRSLENERQMIEAFAEVVRKKRTDVLCTYNGDVFDLPYLRERAKKLRANFRVGRTSALPKSRQHGLRSVTRLDGRIHFDVFAAVDFLDTVGAVKLQRLTLQKAYEEILGKKKEDIKKFEIYKAWDAGGADLAHLADYNRSDSVACLELAEYALPLELELARVCGETFFEVSRSSASQLVESLLMHLAFKRGELIPNKPREAETVARQSNPIEGAFVKTPEPGIYENLAMLDFKSLYPSIIISHNIDPATLNCSCCSEKEKLVSPQGHSFCTKQKGVIPAMLAQILDARGKVKQQMKGVDRDSHEYKKLYARQWALKIIANATYGYLAYARSRWYSRECAESTTAWAREFIHKAIDAAEQQGFKVIYGDTDSVLMLYKKGSEQAVLDFQKKFNSGLPQGMELELEDFYPRGIFVSKKQGENKAEKGAKKKYALINREGRIKIRGFELVRRDWSRVARQTQRQVLEILLKEGDVVKAKAVVKKIIEELRAGRVLLEDCVILTQLRKKAKAYEVMSPEVAAFLKAKKAGLPYTEYSTIPYVVTRAGKSISEKAEPVELAKDYDAEYYVNNQVLPAVLKILSALKIDADELLSGGKQMGLGSW